MRKLPMRYLLGILLFYSCAESKESKYLFNENFDVNEIGWPEELTSSHETEILNGVYLVNSKSTDTSKIQSSVSPGRTVFLMNLPKNYEITTSISRLKGDEDTEYGIRLTSASLSYRFALADSGDVYVSEYDYNTEEENIIISGNYYRSGEIGRDPVVFMLRITGRNLRFYLNDKFIGEAKVKTSQWDDFLFLLLRDQPLPWII